MAVAYFYRIVAPHFVAGVHPGILAAPIIAYMRDWSGTKIEEYCLKKGWSYEKDQLAGNAGAGGQDDQGSAGAEGLPAPVHGGSGLVS